MKILGHTGLVKIEDRAEWERVKAAMIAAGFKPTGSGVYLADKTGRIVTDKELGHPSRKIVCWYVELEALKQAGLEP
jgi:hypothetical protein